MRNNLPLFLACLVLLGACSTRPYMRADFGKSNANNVNAEIVDSSAVGRERPTLAVDGQKVEKGLERYRADRPDASREKLVQDMNK